MPRPKTKEALIETSNKKFRQLWEQIESLDEEIFNTSFDFSNFPNLKQAHWGRDRNVRDILIHLYEWHQLLLNCVNSNKDRDSAKPVKFLPEPYTFRTISDLNNIFWEKHQNTSYENAKRLLYSSHNEVMNLIESVTNKALFTKKHFDWTGTTSMGSYCISATSSHYDWAIQKLKKHKKNVIKSRNG